jgi:cytoskeletal protein CcmA (bactofilin family)
MTGGDSGNAGALPSGISTLIGAGMQIVGDITCKGTLRVQGTILGNVRCDKNRGDALVVDSLGAVTGEVHAANVAVRGRIVGPIDSAHSMEVHEGATVTGDVSFRALAIHAGGVVDGLLTPSRLADPGREPADIPLPEIQASGEPTSVKRFWEGRRGMVAVVLFSIAATGAWLARDSERDMPADMAASPAVVPAVALREASSLQEDGQRHGNDARDIAQPELTPPPQSADQAEPAGPTDNGQEGVVKVRGANPNRPTGVFLLISNDAAILHRKKHDDPGDGTQTAIPQGEKISVTIAPDEIIRISKGRDVTIYFQGQKVPRRAIENESWIRFVPR